MIITLGGTNVINAGAGDNQLFTASGADTVMSSGNDIISGVTGTGNDTIFQFGQSALVGEFSKNLTYIGGSGSATILSGTGSYVINAGTGGGLFAGGQAGHNVIAGGTGTAGSTIFGGGDGDLLLARGSGVTMLVAGSGNETLSGADSSANNIFFSTVGSASMTGGAGNDTFFLGSGSTTVDGGGGSDVFAISSGQAGGHVTINNFNSNEKVQLQGYSAGEASTDLANQQAAGGSTMITLTDHTTITFVGVSKVTSSSFG